jgi:radical SAM superfamily enzyme YgiQ (UPF0313 family)
MSFGVVQTMITSLKNNKNQLSKYDRFKNAKGHYGNNKTEFNFPKATPEELKLIKEKIQRENKQLRRKQYIIVSVLFCIILFFVMYLIA